MQNYSSQWLEEAEIFGGETKLILVLLSSIQSNNYYIQSNNTTTQAFLTNFFIFLFFIISQKYWDRTDIYQTKITLYFHYIVTVKPFHLFVRHHSAPFGKFWTGNLTTSPCTLQKDQGWTNWTILIVLTEISFNPFNEHPDHCVISS